LLPTSFAANIPVTQSISKGYQMMRRSNIWKLSASIKAAYPFLEELGIEDINAGCYDGKKWAASGAVSECISPITGKPIGPKVTMASAEDTARCVDEMMKVKAEWAMFPAPKRGEVVRQIGDELRKYLKPLGSLLAVEVGKILPEGVGEVQEFVDICDFATGLSRQLPGQVLPSERPGHFMMEQWQPMGAVGIICAFNFPIAVAGWNGALSLTCGNTHIWKSAPTTSLCSIATQKIITRVLERNNLPGALATFVTGDASVGEAIVSDKRVPVVSFTGSCAAGRVVGKRLADRFARPILELGGNNAIFIMDDANIEMAVRATLFGAVGTAGQRCTTCRRLYIHESKYDEVVKRLSGFYGKLKVGNPLEEGVLVGPLHTLAAVDIFERTVAEAIAQGGKVRVGGKAFRNSTEVPGPNYVQPTIIEMSTDAAIVKEEAFVPILYTMKFKTVEEAIQLNNNVDQGLSASLFTNSLQTQYKWLGPCGADTGIANVNIPTNGAEIGGAFGGEKHTGGGRESGSDSWKQYMRRQTNTINYSSALPLAQGINFGSD
jgi:aldehyde dehydrogenase family 7 member A1